MSITLKNNYASAPATERGRRTLLSANKKGTHFAYCCDNTVFLRSLENPLDVEIYQDHANNVTSAVYAPSGFYVASGDETGRIRIWATDNEDKTLKLEIRPLSGAVRDIAWSDDSKRVVAVGEGKETFAHAFLWDSGSTIGEISGHSKGINSCDFKPNRPYRVATAGEDFQVNFYQGPPFRFSHSNKAHTRFANCVRFSPDGSKFISVGSDSKIVAFDGKTGEQLKEISSKDGHKSSIYSLSWSPDNKQFLTCSADRTCKLWDYESGEVLKTFTFGGNAVDLMQVSTLWSGDHMLSLSLNGDINYLDPENPDKPKHIIQGHNKSVNAVTFNPNTNYIYSGSNNGRISSWEDTVGSKGAASGSGHTVAVTSMRILPEENKMFTCSYDDTVRTLSLDPFEFIGEPIKVSGTPTDLAVNPKDSKFVVAVSTKGIFIIRDDKVVDTMSVDFTPTSVDISPDGKEVAVGSKSKKNILYIYSIDGDSLKQEAALERHLGQIKTVRYSPDGSMIASGDANREIVVWDASSRETKHTGLVFHSSRVTSVAWSPDSSKLASSSLDTNLIVWDLANNKRIIQKNAHNGGASGVAFKNDNTVISVGDDNCVKTWEFGF
eukprot:gb/GECH01012599.1/.p1 GENE.gb/GECH01012599.1/~~gb/GECH01012599.1/.p1  ORF type:complete len:607 (+),score=133.53 gb/GECH01012599.1/:1-1821(+)